MKTINVAQLKAHLSACLRLARSGEQIIVLDRSEPIARILPLDDQPRTSWESLA
jgi:prevent-host-death family protein